MFGCFDHTGTDPSTFNFKGFCNHGNGDLFTSKINM